MARFRNSLDCRYAKAPPGKAVGWVTCPALTTVAGGMPGAEAPETRFMQHNRDMSVWLAPVEGTRGRSDRPRDAVPAGPGAQAQAEGQGQGARSGLGPFPSRRGVTGGRGASGT